MDSININSETGSDYSLWRAFKKLEADWEATISESASSEAAKTLNAQVELAKQKQREGIAKDAEKRRNERDKKYQKERSDLKKRLRDKRLKNGL